MFFTEGFMRGICSELALPFASSTMGLEALSIWTPLRLPDNITAAASDVEEG
jgi:hypothetical protein